MDKLQSLINENGNQDNLWILTEEKPKCSVIKTILKIYERDFNVKILECEDLKIIPIVDDQKFQFTYVLDSVSVEGINKIFIKSVSGNSSFFDFLFFRQKSEPEEGSLDNLLMVIEETKTDDSESRNTGVYQRCSKFVFFDYYKPEAKKYMLYNSDALKVKTPSDTNKFGTNMLLTLGVSVEGKDMSKYFAPFKTINEIIVFKSKMKKPPKNNIPIEITRCNGKIKISGRLSKPADQGNIGHDPNIGALSIISKCIRVLGWKGDIVITKHGVDQEYISKTKGKNKFLYICKMLKLKLDGIIMPPNVDLPAKYWRYEMKSEKVASILLHIIGENNGLKEVYQNHAGCERGYFISPTEELISLPKMDCQGKNLYIPDLVLFNSSKNEILLIEGKQMSTLDNGIEELENYDSIENEFIKVNYPKASIIRCLSIFGDNEIIESKFEKVLLHLNLSGEVVLGPIAPKYIKDMIAGIGL